MCRGITLPASLQRTIKMYVTQRPQSYMRIDQWTIHILCEMANKIKHLWQKSYTSDQVHAAIASGDFSVRNCQYLSKEQLRNIRLTDTQLLNLMNALCVQNQASKILRFGQLETNDQTLLDTLINNLTTQDLLRFYGFARMDNHGNYPFIQDAICRRFNHGRDFDDPHLWTLFTQIAIDNPDILVQVVPTLRRESYIEAASREQKFQLLRGIASIRSEVMDVPRFQRQVLDACLEQDKYSDEELHQIKDAFIVFFRHNQAALIRDPFALKLDALGPVIPKILYNNMPYESFHASPFLDVKRALYIAAGKDPKTFETALQKCLPDANESWLNNIYSYDPRENLLYELTPMSPEQQKLLNPAIEIRNAALVAQARKLVQEPDRKLREANSPLMRRVVQTFTYEEIQKIKHLLVCLPDVEDKEIFGKIVKMLKEGIDSSNCDRLTALLLKYIELQSDNGAGLFLLTLFLKEHLQKFENNKWVLLCSCAKEIERLDKLHHLRS